jgi:cytochrome c peroxidase
MNTAFTTLLCTLAVTASLAIAVDTPSLEQGRELFNSVKLGTNGKSCSTCHPDGRGLGDAGGYDTARLGKIINQCIDKSLKGTALPLESPELQSLIMYVQSLAAMGKN